MPFYQKRGTIPEKRHIQFRDKENNLFWEELISREGFSSIYSNVYHKYPPTKVKAIGDGEGVFTQGMGMLVNKPKQGFGMRSWRYSMLVNNGEVVKIFEEPGKNNASDDDDPFTVSDADTMLNFIKSNAG